MPTVALSTGKRTKAASRVFGEALFQEASDSSLCYSVSPGGSSSANTTTTNPQKGSGFMATVVAAAPIPEGNELMEQDDDHQHSPEPTVLFVPNDGRASHASNASSKRSSASSLSVDEQSSGSTVSVSASTKRVSFAENKENTRHSPPSRMSALATDVVTKNPFAAATGMQKIREEELSRLRAANKSPMRQEMMRKTEEAIRNATTSVANSLPSIFRARPNSLYGSTINNNVSNSKRVDCGGTGGSGTITAASINQALNATRKAKSTILRDKSKAARSVRFQWQRENSETKILNQKVEENRRQIRTIQKKFSSHHFQEKARREESKKFDRLAKLEEEYTFKSEVYCDHQQQLKAERDRYRRQSTDIRARIRGNKREGEEKLRLMKIEEEQANFDVKADLHRARKENAKANADARRKSFQFRAGDARKIRSMRSTWREQELQKKHESFELERAAAKDVENYKRKVENDERHDKRNRNLEARERRKREEEQAHEAMFAEHESYELKWAGERDAEAYKKQMQEERRKSLEGRNKEGAHHAKVMQELRCLAKEQEAESYLLKWAGDNDAKAYLAKVAEERRKSLQHRGLEARKVRQYEDNEHARAVQESLVEMALQSDCQKDVEKYKEECAERRRKSLKYRGKQSQLQHLEEEKRRIEQLQKDEESFKLDSLARQDVEEYYKDCQKRRRKSLAWRAKERRRNFEWKREKAEREVEAKAHTSYLQSLDLKHMALAQEQERARQAMDALRSAGCTFQGNPFGIL